MASDTETVTAATRCFTPGQVYHAERDGLNSLSAVVTLDPDTANNWLTLSEGNQKATHGAWQEYTDRPERFSVQPQVLCREGLRGIHYWEVEWSDSPYESVYAGVAYGSIERKSDSSGSQIGNNTESWCFGKYARPGENPKLRAWHNGFLWERPAPPEGCKRVGVLLNWSSGTLTFFQAVPGKLVALYSFNAKFTEPVYPCFWLGQSGNYIHLQSQQRC